jgi:hypothetical protein
MDAMRGEITVRDAAADEFAIILHHRRSMFRDMGEGTVNSYWLALQTRLILRLFGLRDLSPAS